MTQAPVIAGQSRHQLHLGGTARQTGHQAGEAQVDGREQFAGRGTVLRMVLGDGVRLTLVGIVIGAAGGVFAARALGRLLYGIGPTDPVTFVAVAVLLVAVALLASYVPAARATRVDPVVALRTE